MNNPFSINELLKSVSNYPVAKGDVAGHPFHGNQYTDASDQASDGANYILRQGYAVPRDHEMLAEQHLAIAKSIEDGMKNGEIPMSKWGDARKAIEAHNTAAEAHTKAAGVTAENNEAEKNKDYSMRPQRVEASEVATEASEMAGLATAKATGTYLARMARDAGKQGEDKDYTDYLEQEGKEEAAQGDLSGQTKTYDDAMATNQSGANEWR